MTDDPDHLARAALLAGATSFTPMALGACYEMSEAEAFEMLLQWERRGIVKRLNAAGDTWRWAD